MAHAPAGFQGPERTTGEPKITPSTFAPLRTDRPQLTTVDGFQAGDGTRISVRRAGDGGTRNPVVMLHGLQSHSGWFVRSQIHLAAAGHPVFSPDRRGSGFSLEPRGDCRRMETLLGDIGEACRFACAESRTGRVHLVGHCFGALPALLYASRHAGEVLSLTLASPALYSRVGPSPVQRLRIAWALIGNGGAVFPLPYPEEWLADDAECLSMIRSDALALRGITASFFHQISRARRQIKAAAARLRVPTFMATAAGDRICDNGRNLDLFARLRVSRRLHVDYPQARHILEFSPDRSQFLRDLGEWTASTEPRPLP